MLTFLDDATKLSDKEYMQAHLAWRGVSEQQIKMLGWFKSYFATFQYSGNKPFRVLSIGSGTGILDEKLLAFLKKVILQDIEYDGCDPNAEECRDFIRRMSGLEDHRTTVNVHNTVIQEFSGQGYDLIIGVHVLYYDKECTLILEIAKQKLSNNGSAIFLNAPDQPLSKYFRYTMAKLYGITPLLSPEIVDYLDESGINYWLETISARANIKGCFIDAPDAERLLSFICHGNVALLSKKDKQRYLYDLMQHCEENEGSLYIKHNVDAFVIT